MHKHSFLSAGPRHITGLNWLHGYLLCILAGGLFGAIYVGGLLSIPTAPAVPAPTVWVACSDGTGCATSPRYRDGQTVNIHWGLHPAIPASPLDNDPGAAL